MAILRRLPHSKSPKAVSRIEANPAGIFTSASGGTMTGTRTFVNSRGRISSRESRIMQTIDFSVENEDMLPLSDNMPQRAHV